MGRIAEAQEQRAEVALAQREGTAQLRAVVESRRDEFAAALPQHVDPRRFVRAALSMLNTVPRIKECAPATIVTGLMQAAQLGLEVSDVRGQAFLIPRWSSKNGRMEAAFQLGYRGMIDLAARAGITVDDDVIREGDRYHIMRGTSPVLEHEPSLDEPGAPIAYYAVAHFADGRQARFKVWSRRRVEQHRDKFASSRTKKGEIYGPWVDHFDGMAAKTVIRDLLDTLPIQVELREALFVDAAAVGLVEPTVGQQAELDAGAPFVDAEAVDAEVEDSHAEEIADAAIEHGQLPIEADQ